MNPRAIAAVLPLVFGIALIIYVLENYGRAIAIVAIGSVLLLIAFFLLSVYGPKLPPFLGGDPPPPEPVPEDLQWSLYLAMISNDMAEIDRLLAKGADPVPAFTPDCRIRTGAPNCYAFAKTSAGRAEFAEKFRHLKNVT